MHQSKAMESTDQTTSATTPNDHAYWIFQLIFWSLLLLPDLFTISYRTLLDFAWSVGSILLIFLVSHLARRTAVRHRWFYLPPGRMIPRLVIVVVTMGTVYFASGFPEKFFQSAKAASFFMSPGIMFAYWQGSLFVACSWMGCYMALNEWSLRRVLEIDQLRAQLASKEKQLENLKSQLKPHFLFNSLNTLRGLILEDSRQAQHILTQLSTLLRYSLRSDAMDMAPLSEELDAVEGYLAVEKSRYEERLRVRWEVDGQARSARVPPMLLQTLVENAVKHGVAPRVEGGEVTIRAATNEGHLCLEVINTGELRPASADTGIGLRNTRERLRLLYGARAHFVLENTAAGCVRAQVLLPTEHTLGATA